MKVQLSMDSDFAYPTDPILLFPSSPPFHPIILHNISNLWTEKALFFHAI